MRTKIVGTIKKTLAEHAIMQIVITSAIAVLCIAAFFYLYRAPGGPHHTYRINLTESGFVPSTLTIAQGDTVVFTTTTSKAFWPASDLHPTHEIYPEFDPKMPIDPDKSWSFRFDRVGEWRFHDHLDSFFRGTIRVISENAPTTSTARDQTNVECGHIPDDSEKLICLSGILERALAQDDIIGAFDILAQSYAKDSSASGCHALTHRIGERAYQVYVHGGQVKLDEKTLYCGYGFYHGFMEALIQDTKDLQVARNFCRDADRQISNNTIYSTRAEGMCYHGIGHGFADGNDPRTWGNPEALIAPALKLCGIVSTNPSHRASCASGVFNSLAGMYFNAKYRLAINMQDPYWLCAKQEVPEFKQMCYEELNTLVLRISDDDFARATKYIAAIKENAYRKSALKGLATFYAFFAGGEKFNNVLATCTKLKDEEPSCIYGFALGLVENGAPEKESDNAFVFCGSNQLNKQYAAECFQQVLNSMAFLYTKEKMSAVCRNIKKEYLYLCATF